MEATTTAVCTWDPPSEVTFTNLNQSYGTIQFYHGDALGSPLRILGGAQDNGSLLTTDGQLNNWTQVFGGGAVAGMARFCTGYAGIT